MSSQGTFIVPPTFGVVGDYSNLPSYGIGATQNISWILPDGVEDTVLWLIKDGNGLLCTELNLALTSCQSLLAGNRGNSWLWPLQEPQNYTESAPVYWLSMRSSDTTSLFASHYFNILPESLLPISSTSSTSTSTATTSATSTAGTSISSIVSSTATPITTSGSATPSPTASSGVSKIAIGVGVGIGVPLIAALVAISFFLYKSHKRKSAKTSASYVDHKDAINPPSYIDHSPAQHTLQTRDVQQTPQEMPGYNHYPSTRTMPAELHSSR